MSGLCIEDHVTGWRRTTSCVTHYPDCPGWVFEVDVDWKTNGEFGFHDARALPPPGCTDATCPPQVLDRVGWLVRCAYGAGDLDPGIAFAASAMPNPKYQDEHRRATAAASIHQMEHSRYETARSMGLAAGDRPRPRVAIGKAFDIPFGTTRNPGGEEVVDEAKPGNTVDNWIKLAHTLKRPGTDRTYLPTNPEDKPQSVGPEHRPPPGPHNGREITLFCWRTPHRVPTIAGRPVALGRVVGPDVIIEAHWTDLKRHFENRPRLRTFKPLTAVPPAEVVRRLAPIIQQIQIDNPGANVKARITDEASPPSDYPFST